MIFTDTDFLPTNNDDGMDEDIELQRCDEVTVCIVFNPIALTIQEENEYVV